MRVNGRAACAYVAHGDLIYLMSARRLPASEKPANDVDQLRAELAAVRADLAQLRGALPSMIAAAVASALQVSPRTTVTSRDDLREAEKAAMLRALEAHGWNKTAAAEALGIPRRTFHRRCVGYGIE